jgi:hypothetical protein
MGTMGPCAGAMTDNGMMAGVDEQAKLILKII